MDSKIIPSAMFACSHCGQAGVLWKLPPDSLGHTLPRVSNGFHLEEGRVQREGMALVVCNHCDEFQSIEDPGLAQIVARS
jgi:hypothetical protein